MINVALIGFGGVVKNAHLPVYLKLQDEGKVKLVAVCDITPERFEEKTVINIGSSESSIGENVKKYTDWREMLNNESVDMVDVCVPTYLHAEISIAVLSMGYDVICEKPMSLTYEDCCRMTEAAKKYERKLMIAQCLRFSDEYNYLKKVVEEKTFGKVLTGVFSRLSIPPVWGWENWYMDFNKSHGCITDLHIHDIDIIRYIFGEPSEVSCFTKDLYSKKDIAHSTLKYNDFSVLAIADWTQEGLPFTAEYRVAFEKATVVCDANGVKVYSRGGGEEFKPEMAGTNCYYGEIDFFVDSIENGTENISNPPESAALSIKLINTLIESSDKHGEFVKFEV